MVMVRNYTLVGERDHSLVKEVMFKIENGMRKSVAARQLNVHHSCIGAWHKRLQNGETMDDILKGRPHKKEGTNMAVNSRLLQVDAFVDKVGPTGRGNLEDSHYNQTNVNPGSRLILKIKSPPLFDIEEGLNSPDSPRLILKVRSSRAESSNCDVNSIVQSKEVVSFDGFCPPVNVNSEASASDYYQMNENSSQVNPSFANAIFSPIRNEFESDIDEIYRTTTPQSPIDAPNGDSLTVSPPYRMKSRKLRGGGTVWVVPQEDKSRRWYNRKNRTLEKSHNSCHSCEKFKGGRISKMHMLEKHEIIIKMTPHSNACNEYCKERYTKAKMISIEAMRDVKHKVLVEGYPAITAFPQAYPWIRKRAAEENVELRGPHGAETDFPARHKAIPQLKKMENQFHHVDVPFRDPFKDDLGGLGVSWTGERTLSARLSAPVARLSVSVARLSAPVSRLSAPLLRPYGLVVRGSALRIRPSSIVPGDSAPLRRLNVLVIRGSAPLIGPSSIVAGGSAAKRRPNVLVIRGSASLIRPSVPVLRLSPSVALPEASLPPPKLSLPLALDSSQFSSFSENQLALVNDIWKAPADEKVMVKFSSLEITRRDLHTLAKLNWLNDSIIFLYFKLIERRGNCNDNLPSIYTFNTFFWPRLSKGGHAGVEKWTEKFNIFDRDLVLVPINLHNVHWTLVSIDISSKRIMYYDSMFAPQWELLERLRDYLATEWQRKQNHMNFGEWHMHCVEDCPQQKNGRDCGVFMCKFADYISRGITFNFSQDHMQYFRTQMVWEIMKKQLCE